MAAALGVPAGIYNVAGDEPLRRRAYFDALADTPGVAPPRLFPAWLAPRMGAVSDMIARLHRLSNRKPREHSDWKPRFPSMRERRKAVIEELRSIQT